MKTYSLFTTLTTMYEVAHVYPPIQQRLLYGGGAISQNPSSPNILLNTNWPQDPCLTP